MLLSLPRLSALLFVVAMFVGSVASASPTRTAPTGQFPADRRLQPLKDLNGPHPMTVPASAEAWKARAADLRQQVLVSQGIWPLPTKTPLNAVVHGRVERADYTVERVYFESVPGHFVSGSLYRPRGKTGPFPAVLCPHGHWPNGRFHDHGEAKIKTELVTGGERFEIGGRHPVQARCVQLARLGCVVLLYDMIGYADSQQLAHRDGVRAAMNTPDHWGFFSPQAELHLQSIMGLQTWNSIRALDWMSSLPDVDATRIGVTGASGGGTQTFLLAAVDPRVTVAWPAVMVSTAMQGGCTCENANYLRRDCGNIDLAAIFAPKPLGMSAADDWTKELMTRGYPELKRVYTLLGAPQNVFAKALTDHPHNYNYPSRALMYAWFNKHLKLGHPEPIVEADFVPLTKEEATVWDAAHPQPRGGDDYERSLVGWLTTDARRQLADPSADETLRAAWRTLIGRQLGDVGKVEQDLVAKNDCGDYWEFHARLNNTTHGEQVPTTFFMPKSWNQEVVVWTDAAGRSMAFDASSQPSAPVRSLLQRGYALAVVDVFGTGEFTADGLPTPTQRLVTGPKIGAAAKFAGYTFGYNHALVAQRAHDLLSVISFVRSHDRQPRSVHLLATGNSAPWAAAARFAAGEQLTRSAIDTAGFRFARLTEFDDPNFWPGAVKYGDLPALLRLAGNQPLWTGTEPTTAAPTPGRAGEQRVAEAVAWLVGG